MTEPSGPHVLVVDDEEDTCRNLQDILSDLGYRVDVAHDGPSALELLAKKPYDIALLDLKMPGMDGLTLYREIKKRRAGTVAIIVTAYASSATAEAALAAGAWQIVPKPIELPRLLRLVDEAAGQPLVMVVDDDPDLCDSLWDVLRERGYRVSVAHGYAQAADSLRDTNFTVVLIDMKLPDGDGDNVFGLVRQANPEARTVLITGYRSEMEQRLQKVLQAGADAVCYKPFDIPALLGTLTKLTVKGEQGG